MAKEDRAGSPDDVGGEVAQLSDCPRSEPQNVSRVHVLAHAYKRIKPGVTVGMACTAGGGREGAVGREPWLGEAGSRYINISQGA